MRSDACAQGLSHTHHKTDNRYTTAMSDSCLSFKRSEHVAHILHTYPDPSRPPPPPGQPPLPPSSTLAYRINMSRSPRLSPCNDIFLPVIICVCVVRRKVRAPSCIYIPHTHPRQRGDCVCSCRGATAAILTVTVSSTSTAGMIRRIICVGLCRWTAPPLLPVLIWRP